MADKTGKVRTIRMYEAPDPQTEAKQMAAYEKAKAKAAAKEEKEAAAAREASLTLTKADFLKLNQEDYAALADKPRRRAREAALLLLFQVEQGDCPWAVAEKVLDDILVQGESAAFALEMAHAAWEDKDRSDRLLETYSREWSVDRFAPVDRVILHLALSELWRGKGENAAIIMNEAIELGKKFGDQESGSFINGLLDNIYNQQIKKGSME